MEQRIVCQQVDPAEREEEEEAGVSNDSLILLRLGREKIAMSTNFDGMGCLHVQRLSFSFIGIRYTPFRLLAVRS
jgi:hypothetical protein